MNEEKPYIPPCLGPNTSPFFRVSCGCLGLHVGQADYVVIHQCDNHDFEPRISFSASWRSYDEDKIYQPLTAEQTSLLCRLLGNLVCWGYDYMQDKSRLLAGIEYAKQVSEETAEFLNTHHQAVKPLEQQWMDRLRQRQQHQEP